MKVDTKIRNQLIQEVLNLEASKFDALALDVFQYQAAHNPVYRQYMDFLGIQPQKVRSIEAIPFLPIDLFKNHTIKAGNWGEKLIFRSSGTTGSTRSQHSIRSLEFYQQITQIGFERIYDSLSNYCVLALLPSYLERQDSSLVYMAQHFMTISGNPNNGFFLDNLEALKAKLIWCQQENQACLLIGVSFALLDLAEQLVMDLPNIIVMETGGMKGRRKELTREELHGELKNAFGVDKIHSEYGMTELLSQGYSKGNGIFEPIPSMKVFCREINDPLSLQQTGKTGAINIIDLANIDSCAFIATEDIGRVYANGHFEVLGRLDYSAIRGCNLMVADL